MLFLWLWACGGGGSDDDPATPTDDSSVAPTSATTADTHTASETAGPTADTAPDPCSVGPLSLVPGVGPYTVYPVADDDTLVIIQGPQGGYHVDVAGIVEPVTDFGAIVRPLLTLDDDTIVAGDGDVIQVGFSVYDADACRGQFADARMFVLSDAQSLCAIAGRTATYEVTVETFDGRTTTEARTVVLEIDLLDPYTCDTLP